MLLNFILTIITFRTLPGLNKILNETISANYGTTIIETKMSYVIYTRIAAVVLLLTGIVSGLLMFFVLLLYARPVIEDGLGLNIYILNNNYEELAIDYTTLTLSINSIPGAPKNKKMLINTTNITDKYNLTRLGSLKLFHSSSLLLSNSNINTANLTNTNSTNPNPANPINTDLEVVANNLNMIKSYDKLLKEKEYEDWKNSTSTYSESFGNVDESDPFFGVLPKIFKSLVNDDNIPLEQIIKENGLLKSIMIYLNQYPLSTILAAKDKNIDIKKNDLIEMAELKEKLDSMDKRIGGLEGKIEGIGGKLDVALDLDKKLNQLADRSVMALKAVDKGDIALLGLQFLSPFFIYLYILNTYGKVVIDNSYIPKSVEEKLYIEKNRVRIIERFNRIGVPLLLVGYMFVTQINAEKNKVILSEVRESILGVFKKESEVGINSSFFLFFTKNKNNILIKLVPVLKILIGFFIKPVISNNYPWLYNILNLYGLKFSISLIFIWVFILCLDYGLKLIIYNFYIKNNARINSPVILEWLINSRYSELWDQSQSTLKNEHNKFYVRNFYFHLIILFILFLLLIYIFIK